MGLFLEIILQRPRCGTDDDENDSRRTRRQRLSWRGPFRISTTVLLSLLLPLSFLVLARLAAARYLASSAAAATSDSWASFLFMYGSGSNSAILYAVVSLVSVAAFADWLTSGGRVTLVSIIRRRHQHRTVVVAWILLCALQACVGFGLEGSISAGIDGSGFGRESCFFVKALLFLGLHETMMFWSRAVVKPVVDDTVTMGFITTTPNDDDDGGGFGSNIKEGEDEDEGEVDQYSGVAERVGMGLSLGALWWWKLRDEVDSLVVVPELMLQAGGHGILGVVGVEELVGWWLYYLTVSVGTVTVLKGLVWLLKISLQRCCCRRMLVQPREEDVPSDSVFVLSLPALPFQDVV